MSHSLYRPSGGGEEVGVNGSSRSRLVRVYQLEDKPKNFSFLYMITLLRLDADLI